MAVILDTDHVTILACRRGLDGLTAAGSRASQGHRRCQTWRFAASNVVLRFRLGWWPRSSGTHATGWGSPANALARLRISVRSLVRLDGASGRASNRRLGLAKPSARASLCGAKLALACPNATRS